MARKQSTIKKPGLVAGMGPLSREEVNQLRRGDIISVDLERDRGCLHGFVQDIEEGSIWEGGPIGMIVLYLLVPLWRLGEGLDHVCPHGMFLKVADKEGDVGFDVAVTGIPIYVPMAHEGIIRLSGRITAAGMRRFGDMQYRALFSREPMPEWWKILNDEIRDLSRFISKGAPKTRYAKLTREDRAWTAAVAATAKRLGG